MLEWSDPPLATVPTQLSPASGTIVAPRTAAILAMATELPTGRLTSAELAASLGISEDWIVSRTGIRERRRTEPSERLSDYAARAGAAALAARTYGPRSSTW